jgi:signal transduction histidine kinase
LSIARRAIEVHGGTIAAENAEGGGLRVAMRIPVERGTAQSARR